MKKIHPRGVIPTIKFGVVLELGVESSLDFCLEFSLEFSLEFMCIY